jgi:hypothetical protein
MWLRQSWALPGSRLQALDADAPTDCAGLRCGRAGPGTAARGCRARAPRTGFWESAPLTQRGESASILERRAGRRTLVTNISTPAPDCRQVFGIFGDPGARLPRLAVDRRGRFAGARDLPTEGIAAVRGRFHGRRPRGATLVGR